jgi:hypothetical protein
MPTLDDLPTLASFTPSGDDLLPIYDLTGSGSSKVRKVSLNQINGVSAADVVSTAAGTITITSRLTLIASGGASLSVTAPEPSGALRDFIVMNGGTGTATLSTTAGATFYTSLIPAGATSTPILTTGTARYLSNGVAWYRTH